MIYLLKVSILTVLFLNTFTFGLPVDQFDNQFDDIRNILFNKTRIVGGEIAVRGEMKSMVGLISKKGFCGGSLIAPNIVLTAAHCVYRTSVGDWRVIGDLLKLTAEDLENGQTKTVKRIIAHEYYISSKVSDDIALLALDSPFSIHSHFGPLEITESLPVEYETCRVAGWGTEQENGTISTELKVVDIGVFPNKVCTDSLFLGSEIVPWKSFCAGALEGGRDSCQGDSGGGLICDGVIKGIVSFGIGCGRVNKPGVYTDVFKYRDWITAGIKDILDPQPPVTVKPDPSSAHINKSGLLLLCVAAMLKLIN